MRRLHHQLENLPGMKVIRDPRLARACFMGDHRGGAYQLPGPCGASLRIIASDATDPIAEGWEHVSISTERRIPNWTEMCFVKDLFWDPEETVIQLHPPKSQWISNAPHCLHLWHNTREAQPLPPSILVGIKELGELPQRRRNWA
jgi:hypothetical protein